MRTTEEFVACGVSAFGIRLSTFGQAQKPKSRESKVGELRTFRPSIPPPCQERDSSPSTDGSE